MFAWALNRALDNLAATFVHLPPDGGWPGPGIVLVPCSRCGGSGEEPGEYDGSPCRRCWGARVEEA